MKKLYLLFLTSLFLFIAGCTRQEMDANIFEIYLIHPFVAAIEYIAIFFDKNYGLAIVLLTLMIRFALLPLMMDQYKKQHHLKKNMDIIRPDIEKLQLELKNTKNQDKQLELQQEMMKLYKEHDISPFNVGCLPLIIQMPLLMGFYYAIRTSTHIAHTHFLWFSLGETDMILTILAGIIYYFQFHITQSSLPDTQKSQMKYVGLLSPMMIVIISYNAPSALPLYWVIGGLFLIIQTYICQKLYS